MWILPESIFYQKGNRMKVIVLPALLTGASTNQKIAVRNGMDRKMGNAEFLFWTTTFVFLFIIVFTTHWDGTKGY